MTKVEVVTTVQRMAFVWSRLALAAVLAAGAACAPTEACPDQVPRSATSPCSQTECDGARLVCSDTGYVLFRDEIGGALVSDAPGAAAMPRIAIVAGDDGTYEAPALRANVLVVAPKTSPPQT